MARVSARRRWQQLADRYGEELGFLTNRAITSTLREGVRALVANTVHDSSRSASHWVVIPNKGSVNPTQWREYEFQPTYGRPPVGYSGDAGKNEQQAIKLVSEREYTRSISKAVSGRDPATRFVFKNSTPEFYDDRLGEETGGNPGQSTYRNNAGIAEALEAARSRMNKHFNQLAMSNFRKRPLMK